MDARYPLEISLIKPEHNFKSHIPLNMIPNQNILLNSRYRFQDHPPGQNYLSLQSQGHSFCSDPVSSTRLIASELSGLRSIQNHNKFNKSRISSCAGKRFFKN